MNNVSLMGRLTADPELKSTQNGVEVTNFSIAVDREFTAKGEEKQTDFINIVAWRQTAVFVNKYFKKGKMIAITGSIQTRNYEDKQGNKRTAFEVVADRANFCGDKSDGKGPEAGQAAPVPQHPPAFNPNDFAEVSTDNSDLPF